MFNILFRESVHGDIVHRCGKLLLAQGNLTLPSNSGLWAVVQLLHVPIEGHFMWYVQKI